jgi:ribose transport system substrate-binding protein
LEGCFRAGLAVGGRVNVSGEAMPVRYLLLCALLGCASALSWAGACIQVVPAGSDLTFWAGVGKGAKAAGQALGVEIYFRGPKNEANAAEQARIANLIWTLKCQALVLAPSAPRAALVSQLHTHGIPTVYIDRALDGAKVVALVATDNYQAGRQAAEAMAGQLRGKTRVAVLRMKKGVASTDARERGFVDKARSLGLTVVTDTYLGASTAQAWRQAKIDLARMAGHVDGVFAPNESTTQGVLYALRDQGLAGKVVFVGFDFNDQLYTALLHGEVSALVVQQPYRMGYQGVVTAYRAAHGQRVASPFFDTGVVVLDRNTLSAPDISALLQLNYGFKPHPVDGQ